MKKTTMRAYAKLIAVTGARVQKGQEVNIIAELDQPEFVTMLVDECYKAGAAILRASLVSPMIFSFS